MNAEQYRNYVTQVASNIINLESITPTVPFTYNRAVFHANQIIHNNRQVDVDDPANSLGNTPYFGTGSTDWANHLFRTGVSKNARCN